MFTVITKVLSLVNHLLWVEEFPLTKIKRGDPLIG